MLTNSDKATTRYFKSNLSPSISLSFSLLEPHWDCSTCLFFCIGSAHSVRTTPTALCSWFIANRENLQGISHDFRLHSCPSPLCRFTSFETATAPSASWWDIFKLRRFLNRRAKRTKQPNWSSKLAKTFSRSTCAKQALNSHREEQKHISLLKWKLETIYLRSV